jgi:hypothetical protein
VIVGAAGFPAAVVSSSPAQKTKMTVLDGGEKALEVNAAVVWLTL